MDKTIIAAVISGLCVAIPSVIATVTNNKKHSEVTLYRIDQLEKKQDKHNSLIERMYKIEGRVSALENKFKGGQS